MHGRTLLVAFLLSVGPVAAAAEKPSPEENILKRASVSADADGLLTFFRGRTLSDSECKQFGKLIHQLGAENFEDRENATKALQKVGGRATPLLRTAKHDADVEIARRADLFLKAVAAPAPLPAVAAARLLARRAPADAVDVLLAYLPFAADAAVEDEVLTALLALTPNGKADPALIAALTDPLPIKRGAAAYVLGRKRDKADKNAARKLLADADATVRWQAACALLTVHDRAAVPVLVELLADGPFDTAWRSEEVLHRLAGDKITTLWLDDTPKQRGKVRDAWATWWKEKGDASNLTAYTEPPRPLGYTLGVEYNTGRIWECDIDGSIRWEIRDLEGPMDAQVLPNGNVLIAEAHRITERDLKAVVKWEKKIDGEPIGCQRLPDGNIFVSTTIRAFAPTTTRAIEFSPAGVMVYSCKIDTGGGDTNAVCKGRNGHIFFTFNAGINEVQTSGKVLAGFSLPLRGGKYVDIQQLPGNRFLVANSDEDGSVLEVSAAGNVIWNATAPGACGAARLANGNTLVGVNHKVIELDADNKIVWEKDAVGYVRRVHGR